MSELVPVSPEDAIREVIDDTYLPMLGQWYWVKSERYGLELEEVEELDPEHGQEGECLMMCDHVGSNHATFTAQNKEWGICERVMDGEMHERLRPAPEWRAVIEGRVEAAKLELKKAVKLLADQCKNADLLQTGTPQVESMALVVGSDPMVKKQELLDLRDKHIPATNKAVDELTKEIVGNYKNLFLSDTVQAEALVEAAKGVEDKLFALELYAGFEEELLQIGQGKPAPMETPIVIRQMLRYMDEETLIAAEDGGMDFQSLESFDKWVVQNIDQVAPEPRCVVAFQVRRHEKKYGSCADIATALEHIAWHEENKRTYLLIRNGCRVYRINTALDFRPRLIALREEFDGPLKYGERYSSQEAVVVGPKDYLYDKALKDCANRMKQQNRILFIVQGLLDRSKVFEPHPRISLADSDHIERWIVAHHDEEDGLPNSNPPSWEEYRNRCNKFLKAGHIVYAIFDWKRKCRNWREKESDLYSVQRDYFRFEGFSRDREKVRLSEPSPDRTGWQYTKPCRESGWTRGEWGDWPVSQRLHYEVEVERVFNCNAYLPGEYKQFLCDAYTKGAYLKWAPFLLKAERYKKMSDEEKAKL